LPSGKVLVTGGYGRSGSLASAEVYDPATGAWSTTGPLATTRDNHTATLLPSGKVLVTGGYGPGGSAEVYDPATGAWSTTGPLATARYDHTATLLPSGKVLVTGGGGPNGHLASAEVYDPATGAWSTTGPLATARDNHTATLLPSGKVLVTGGYGPGGRLASAEVYEDTGTLQEWAPVITPPAKQQPGELFSITGSRLRGLSEASSGNTQTSATNLPLVSLLSLEGGTLTRATLLGSVSDTEVTVRTPLVPEGYYILSVMTNAIHGGELVRVDGPPLAAPEVTLPGAFVNTPKPVIGGMAKPGNTVVVRLGGAVAGTTRAGTQGEWSFTPPTELAEGLHRIVAIAMDEVGNISPDSEEHHFTVDTSPPEVPKVSAPGPFVNTSKPLIAGNAERDSTVRVMVDGTEAGTATANTEGLWVLISSTVLTEGSHSAVATVADAAGNDSPPSAIRSFTVDTVPPSAPELSSPGAFVNTPKPLIAGKAEPGSTVTMSLNGIPAGTATANTEGLWVFIPATALAEGPHSTVATVTDAAGNDSPPSATHRFTIDLGPPDAPELSAPRAFVDTPKPTISGKAEAGSTVTVWLDGTEAGSTLADEAGTWSFTLATAMPAGSHLAVATATDQAGNTSKSSAEHSFVIRGSHYGWGCTTTPALPAAWALLTLALALGRRWRAR
jgi:hypothetical protein